MTINRPPWPPRFAKAFVRLLEAVADELDAKEAAEKAAKKPTRTTKKKKRKS